MKQNNTNIVRRKYNDSRFVDISKRYWQNKAAVLGLLILLVVIFICVFADYLADPELITAYDVHAQLAPPSADHWFGTDNLGRDCFARVLHGTRISVGIGVGSTLISLVLGIIIAAFCALFKKVDFVVMRFTDIFTSIPGILMAIVLLAVLGGSIFSMIVTLTIVSVPGFVLRIRAVLLGVMGKDYVAAARVSGTRGVLLVIKHILPNAIDPIIVDATMTISSMLLSAAGLSFIGIGVSPPSPEWGAMLNYAQPYLKTAPHMIIFPGIAVALTAMSINLVGDGLRDALDPKTIK